MHRLETKIPPVVIGAAAATLGWLVGLLDLDGSPLDNSTGSIVAVALAVLGVLIAVFGILQFRRAETTVNPHSIDKASNMVTSGIYRFTRNPMYLGMLLDVVASCFGLGTIIGAAVAAGTFVVVLTRLQIRPEERMLDDRFGVVYAQYRAQTRRWI